MIGPSKQFLLISLPITSILVTVGTFSGKDRRETAMDMASGYETEPPTSSHPLATKLRWQDFLDRHSGLQAHRESLMAISSRLPLKQFESLEPELQVRLARFAKQRRTSSTPPFSMCWAPGVSPDVISAFHAVEEVMPAGDEPGDPQAATQFSESGRWSRTATFNSFFERREQGKPTTLRWSFVPDGTSIFGFNGEPTSDSDLIAFLDDRYGESGGSDLTTRTWFQVFQAAFDNISELTGLTYVYEPNDDGASMAQNNLPSGSIGVRGDIRIGGHFIDGQANPNVLAYNFSPNSGDMVIDTSNTAFYGDLSQTSLNLRNVVEHEHGHGLGLNHVCPISQTKLMEPFISRRFRGLQLDDIFSLNRLYGDYFEKHSSARNNDSSGNAALLPVTAGVPYRREYLSIDDNNDNDFYLLENVSAGDLITFRVIPVATPGGFVEGPQNPDGTCAPASNFNFTNIHNLDIAILASNGRTELIQSSSESIGQSEEIVAFEASSGGDYYLEVTGDSANNCQLYTLEVEIDSPSPYDAWAASESIPAGQDGPGQDPDDDRILNVQEYYFGLSPTVADDRIPLEVGPAPSADEFLLTFFRDPNAEVDEVIFETSPDLSTWNEYIPAPDKISTNPIGDLEEVTITVPMSGQGQFIRVGVGLTE